MARKEEIFPFLLSALSGILLYLAFPQAGLGSLAWIALLPLLFVIRDAPPWKAFFHGFIVGMTFYLGSIHWVIHAMVVYGGLPYGLSIMVLIALSIYLSLYFGLFAFISSFWRWSSDLRGILLLPCLWVSLEFLRNYLFTGFPWNLLGYSQIQNHLFLQILSITGIYGLSFLIVLVNVALAFSLLKYPWDATALKALACAGIALSFTLIYGAYRLNHPTMGREMKVAVVQANIDQGMKWDPSRQREIFEIHKSQTLQASRSRPDLILWPETAVPFYLRAEPRWRREIQSLAENIHSYLLVGGADFTEDGGTQYFNSAFLLSPGGNLLEKYDKMHLVPFGEYVPLRRFLPFVNKLVVGVGDFSPGKEAKVLSIPPAKAGAIICFESIFPELSRRYRIRGANLLLNLTNDGWYGRSAAPYQHLAMAIARAVENGCCLVRAANTGISAVITPEGDIVHSLPLFTVGHFVAKVTLSEKPTLYARWGDLFAQCCVVLTLLFTIRCLPSKWRGARKGPKR